MGLARASQRRRQILLLIHFATPLTNTRMSSLA